MGQSFCACASDFRVHSYFNQGILEQNLRQKCNLAPNKSGFTEMFWPGNFLICCGRKRTVIPQNIEYEKKKKPKSAMQSGLDNHLSSPILLHSFLLQLGWREDWATKFLLHCPTPRDPEKKQGSYTVFPFFKASVTQELLSSEPIFMRYPL